MRDPYRPLLAPVLPVWAVLAATCEAALRHNPRPQRRPASALETLLAVAAVFGGARHA